MGVGVQKIQSDFELAYLADWFAGKIPFPPFARSRETLLKARNSMTKDALCHGANGRAIAWFADLLCSVWRVVFWNK